VAVLTWGDGGDTLAQLKAARDLWPPRWRQAPVHYFGTIGSTNDEAARLVRAGEPEGTAVVAREQSSGRGRRGRPWSSEAGGLWISVIITRSGLEPGRLSLAAGVAAARAIEGCCATRCDLKWPNDLMVAGKKVGGILVETLSDRPFAVVGIGINCNQDVTLLEGHPRSTAATLRAATGTAVCLPVLTGRLICELEQALGALRSGEWRGILREWAGRDLLARKSVRVRVGKREMEGAYCGVSERGEMLLRTQEGMREISSADEVRVVGSECGGREAG
jgi:BirA family biotin operon repressor/biotin-[acetyl-CoA-carboxylase] ligase